MQQWIRDLQNKGDIYKSFYSGFYCTPCETFITEKENAEIGKLSQEQSPLCPSCSRGTTYISEESYFFRLSAYQDRLLKFYQENPDFITPPERLNEVTSFVKSGLKDLSISRTSITWGIPFPDDPKHIVYVWADALNNYITAIGFGNLAKEKEFKLWWPADLQVMGKDIVRFHAVYWPAFLMASGLELPKRLLVHGWIKVNNQKMSKSFGNVVDPKMLLTIYGAEQVRYYLTRYMAITQDSEFSTGDLEQKINSDLANDLGNLLNRVVTLAHKHDLYEVKPPQNWLVKELALRDSFWNALELYITDMEDGYFYRSLNNLWKFINEVNSYFHAQEPWKIREKAYFGEVISATCHSLYSIAILLWPVMPNKMEQLLKSLGITLDNNVDMIEELNSNPWTKTFMLNKIPNLFEKFQALVSTNETNAPISQAGENLAQKTEKSSAENITIDDFSKVMLLVGTIEQCEEMPKSDKMLKLQVNFGPYGMRQVLSGVKKHFAPSDLIGKQGIFVYNLAPRAMMGTESQGMMLFAENEDKKYVRATVEHPVPNGTRLK